MLPVLETTAHSPLTIVWFVLITVLWVGFFFLEGFDFGVAMLLPFLGRDDKDRRLMVNTIGPTWDGNEVWLLTAGGATFAAFRRAAEVPQMRLEKRPELRGRQGMWALFGAQGQVLKRGHELAGVLALLERRLVKAV